HFIGCSESDITDGARTLVEQGIADPGALAIIGSGAGGYLALVTMSLEHGLFKAAIVHSLDSGQDSRLSRHAVAMNSHQPVAGPDPYPVAFDPNEHSPANWSPVGLAGDFQ